METQKRPPAMPQTNRAGIPEGLLSRQTPEPAEPVKMIAMPAYVRRVIAEAGVTVERVLTFPGEKNVDAEFGRTAGHFDWSQKNKPVIRIRDEYGLGLVRRPENMPDTDLTETPVIGHEVGHVIDYIISQRGAALRLGSSSRHFRNLCIKHRSGTPGGGGGLGETTGDYPKSRCWELYAAAFNAYYYAPHSLRHYDPQLFDFFSEVDLWIKRNVRRGPPRMPPAGGAHTMSK